MNPHRSFYEKEARKLIKIATGFQENDENFDICLHYAVSHFMDQRHPDVNWFKVKRRIIGLCERLEVESEHEKSRNLHLLSSKYLDILDKGSLPQKSCGFSVLALMCNLAGCGTETDLKQTSTSLTDSGNVDDCLNWSEVLREDDLKCEEISDDESSWTDSEDDHQPVTLLLPGSPSPQSVDSGIGDTPDSCCAAQSLFPPLEPFRPYQPPRPPEKPLLLENYWLPGLRQTKLPSLNYLHHSFDANFTKIWENHLALKYPIYTPETNVVISERHVMRELLWMLQGVKKTFLFFLVNGKYHVRRHVHLPHYTEDTLYNMLVPMCHYGNMMLMLTDFTANTQKYTSFSECQTIKGYVNGLQLLLLQYMKALTACEKRIVSNKEVMSFMKLKMVLDPEFKLLQLLHHAHKLALNRIVESSSPFACAIALLDFLWCHLSESNLWIHEKFEMRVILTLFLTTLHPYLNMLKSSIIKGHIVDPEGEFLLERNPKLNVTDGEFWTKSFVLRELPDFGRDFFLKPIFEDVLLASKSIMMLSSFSSFFDELSHTENEHCDLFAEFVEEFCKRYEKLTSHFTKHESYNELEKQVALVSPNESVRDSEVMTENSKACASYLLLYKLQKNMCIKIDRDQELRQRILNIFDPGNLTSINSVLEEALLFCIKNACALSKKALVQAMKDRHQLMKHLDVMKMYCLMEAGDIMFSFYIEIFKKIFEGEDWKSSTFLNCMFKDAILFCDSKECNKLTFYADEGIKGLSPEPLDELSYLNVSYNVEWPINVILNDDIQKAYSKIFQFLIQIKCAKYSLDDLYCITLTGKKRHIPKIAKWWVRNDKLPHQQIIHGMYILRMKLLHFVNGFHSYIMTEILYSSGLELNEKLEKAESLEDVLLAQQKYVASLSERCLLTPSHSYLWEHIRNLLNLTLKFQQIWRIGGENINLEDIKNIEQKYSTNINLLMCYLNKPRKKDENIHLEILANAISTKFQYPQVFSGSLQ